MAGCFPVLMYHRLESDACPVSAASERSWAVAAATFDEHMQRLRGSGRTGVSMDQIHRALSAGGAVPAGWVGITFDDGNRSDHEHALPTLAAHGFRATFFVCGERIDRELSAANLRELHAAGMHVGSHAMRHRFMTELDDAEERDELVRSRHVLEDVLGAEVSHFAPPGGRWSRRTRAALKGAGYVAVSTSRYGFNAANTPRFAYCRLPVTRGTTWNTFDAMVGSHRHRLWKGYARAAVLGAARGVLGEPGYARVRALGKDS